MTDQSDRDTDQDWIRIAEEHPYWGVLSVEAYRGTTLSEVARKQFFHSGESLVGNVWAFVRKHLNADFNPQRALDFGCGVGRLLIPIAKRSAEAVGIDIAPGMLSICAQNLAAAGVRNASLTSTDELPALPDGSFDFVNTYIVLQHIPPTRGYQLMQRLLRLLSVGGVGSLQLTYGKARRFLSHEAPRAKYYRREGQALIDLVSISEWAPPAGSITMYDYDLNQVFAMITELSGSPMLLLPTNDDDHLGTHIIFARAR